MLDPQKLRAKRTSKNLTQAQAAKLIGIHKSQYVRLEDPNFPVDPGLWTMERLAKGFNCSMMDLITPGPPENRKRANVDITLGRPSGTKDTTPRKRGGKDSAGQSGVISDAGLD